MLLVVKAMSFNRCIIQISDTHFGKDNSSVTEKLLQRINELSPDLLILSGDITQRGREVQFQQAKSFLDRIACDHKLCVPGNHDIPLYNVVGRFFNPLKWYRHYMGAEESQLVFNPVAVIGVNTCNLWHYKNGIISRSQIQRVVEFCQSVPKDYFKIVVAHHPVDALLSSDEENIVENAETAVLTWAAAGVDLIMGGHIHCQFCRNLQLRYPSLQTSLMVSQAGTANSVRTRSGFLNSFTQLTLDANASINKLCIWNYSLQTKTFEPAEHKWIIR